MAFRWRANGEAALVGPIVVVRRSRLAVLQVNATICTESHVLVCWTLFEMSKFTLLKWLCEESMPPPAPVDAETLAVREFWLVGKTGMQCMQALFDTEETTSRDLKPEKRARSTSRRRKRSRSRSRSRSRLNMKTGHDGDTWGQRHTDAYWVNRQARRLTLCLSSILSS